MQRPRRLSASFCKTVTVPGRYGDGRGGHGLSLLCKPASSGGVAKSWSQRFRVNGKPVMIGLGGWPLMSLPEARAMALNNARSHAKGTGLRQVDERQMPSFAEAMERTVNILRPNWTGEKTESQMRFLLSEYVLPHIGNHRVDTVRPGDILNFLTPVAVEKPATAKKVKAQVSQVFQWAIAAGLRVDNPVGNIGGALPKLTGKEHHRALPHAQVADALKTVRDSGANPLTKLAFEFLVLTAARSGEVRLADWAEVDTAAATWVIPASRMKSGKEHRVPLSDRAMGVLEQARGLADGRGLVFRSSTGKALTDSTISKLLRENGIGAVPHGFRSSFRDWCAAQNIDRQVAEASLAHSLGSQTETAYLRSDFMENRREVMQAWGEYVTPRQGQSNS